MTQEVGVLPDPHDPFAEPFLFLSQRQQKLLINADALAESTLVDAAKARSPTPLLQDADTGLSNPALLLPHSQPTNTRSMLSLTQATSNSLRLVQQTAAHLFVHGGDMLLVCVVLGGSLPRRKAYLPGVFVGPCFKNEGSALLCA